MPRVHKVWCAVDCGVAVNPNIIRAQMEGGIGFGLGAPVRRDHARRRRPIQQSNFDDYRSLRINEMPEVEVAIVQSTEKPTGVGEPGVPPIAPAVANAWRQLTGQPVRELPLRPVAVAEETFMMRRSAPCARARGLLVARRAGVPSRAAARRTGNACARS